MKMLISLALVMMVFSCANSGTGKKQPQANNSYQTGSARIYTAAAASTEPKDSAQAVQTQQASSQRLVDQKVSERKTTMQEDVEILDDIQAKIKARKAAMKTNR